jgi:hypothetical protein
MFIIVDERDLVTNGYACRFGQEGIASTGFRPGQFRDWVATAVEGDVQAIETSASTNSATWAFGASLRGGAQGSDAPTIARAKSPHLISMLASLHKASFRSSSYSFL